MQRPFAGLAIALAPQGFGLQASGRGVGGAITSNRMIISKGCAKLEVQIMLIFGEKYNRMSKCRLKGLMFGIPT
jgi:hypothetical protein